MTGSGFLVRPATNTDTTALRALFHAAAFERSRAGEIRSTTLVGFEATYQMAQTRRDINAFGGAVLVAQEAKVRGTAPRLIAMTSVMFSDAPLENRPAPEAVLARWSSENGGRPACLSNLWVHAAYRRRGIAAELLSTALNACKTRMASPVFAWVDPSLAGVSALYTTLGFSFDKG